MEEKYLLTTKSYEDWRNYLLVNSFFFDILLKKLRKEFGISENGIEGLVAQIEWDANQTNSIRHELTSKSKTKKTGVNKVKDIFAIEDQVRRKAYAPIWKIIDKFFDYDLNFSLIHIFMLGGTNISCNSSSSVLTVTSPKDPICETGVYIKFSPYLSERDINLLKKQANKAYESLFKYTHSSIRTQDKDGNRYIKHPILKIRQRKTSFPTNQQLKIYKAVEDALKENFSNNPDSIKMKIVFKSASEKIKKNISSIQRTYHAILNNYNLPSSVDTKKISS